jgi:hypothetical protein
MRDVSKFLALCLTCAAAIAHAQDTGLNGAAEVTGKAERGALFKLRGGRCGVFGYSEWRDGAGVLVAREELIYLGDAWQRYRLQRLSVSQDVEVSREGSVIHLDVRDGQRRRKARLEVEGEVLAGPTLITYLQTKLRPLRLGQPMELQYLVAEQAMVLALRARITDDSSDGLTTVRLEASSALLRPFVPTTLITFDDEGRFFRMRGRLLPQRQSGVALDGVIKVTYPDETRVASKERVQVSCSRNGLIDDHYAITSRD